MRVADLKGAFLDFYVAKAEELAPELVDHGDGDVRVRLRGGMPFYLIDAVFSFDEYSPSTDWSHGGPIIERERIHLVSLGNLENPTWQAMPKEAHPDDWMVAGQEGETALIAAMRCFVASKFGDEVPDAS